MTKRTWRLVAALAALAALALVAATVVARRGGDEPGRKPTVLLLTSLPVMFGEGFSLDAPGSPLLDALKRRFDVVAIAAADPASLAKSTRLVMAQPRAQVPENLVALDQWVRNGGHLLLFADPRLDWPSELPLGDMGRPPPMFADTGLLGHWGLRLDAPDQPGPVTGLIERQSFETRSVGILVDTNANCAVWMAGLFARCRLGKGVATIVADADMLRDPGNAAAIGRLVDELE